MSIPQLQVDGERVYKLSGDLNFMNVAPLWQRSQSLLSNAPSSLIVDLSQVSQSDSSGVALLIHWTRAMQRQKKEISFLHIPQQMQAIIQVSGLEKILPTKRS